jgi:hypothetical protein
MFSTGILKKGAKVKRLFASFFVISFIFSCVVGCAPLIIGAVVGGVGCYAISKDTVQGEMDKPYKSVWDAAIMIAKIRGTITQEDSRRGYIGLDVDSSKAWIRLVRLTRSTIRLRVSAKKYHLPNLTLAQDLYTKIMEEAR